MTDMDEHAQARSWLGACFEDPGEVVCLPWVTLYGFARLVSSRRVMGGAAVTPQRAWSIATSLTRQENSRMIEAGSSHGAIATELFETPALTANDVPDIHLAALAIEHGLELCTHDHGFARFKRLTWSDPLLAE